jgi:hypothetical protein
MGEVISLDCFARYKRVFVISVEEIEQRIYLQMKQGEATKNYPTPRVKPIPIKEE